MAFLKDDGGDHAPPNPILRPARHTPRAATGRSTQDVQAPRAARRADARSAQSRRTKLDAGNARHTPAPQSRVSKLRIDPFFRATATPRGEIWMRVDPSKVSGGGPRPARIKLRRTKLTRGTPDPGGAVRMTGPGFMPAAIRTSPPGVGATPFHWPGRAAWPPPATGPAEQKKATYNICAHPAAGVSSVAPACRRKR
jgi:hypothetical protein